MDLGKLGGLAEIEIYHQNAGKWLEHTLAGWYQVEHQEWTPPELNWLEGIANKGFILKNMAKEGQASLWVIESLGLAYEVYKAQEYLERIIGEFKGWVKEKDYKSIVNKIEEIRAEEDKSLKELEDKEKDFPIFQRFDQTRDGNTFTQVLSGVFTVLYIAASLVQEGSEAGEWADKQFSEAIKHGDGILLELKRRINPAVSSSVAEWEVKGKTNRVNKILLARVARLFWMEPEYREDFEMNPDKFEELVRNEKVDISKLKLEDEFKKMFNFTFEDGINKVREKVRKQVEKKGMNYIKAIADVVKYCNDAATTMPEGFKMKEALMEVAGYLEGFKFRMLGAKLCLELPEDISEKDKIAVTARALLDLRTYRKVMDFDPRIAAIISDVGAPRLHWADKVALDEGIIAFFPERSVFDRLTSMPWAIIYGKEGRLVVNPSPDKASNLQAIREVQPIMDSFPVLKDGQEIKLMVDVVSRYAQPNGISDIERLISGMGIAGIGNLPLEYLYFKEEYARTFRLPEVDDIRSLIVEIANKTQGDVIVRTIDFHKEKAPEQLKDIDKFFGLDFYFKTEKGLSIVKNELMGIMLAYFDSDKKNIRILFPMVSTYEEAEGLRELVERTRVEASGRLGVDYTELDIKFGFMIETKEGARNHEYLSRVADYLAIGTSDLLRSFNQEQYKVYAAIKNIVDTLRRAPKVDKNRPPAEIIIAGDLPNREEFLPYYLYLWKLYPYIYLSPLLSHIQEVKIWLRPLKVQESYEMFDGLFLDQMPAPLTNCISGVAPKSWLRGKGEVLERKVSAARELPHAVGIAAMHMLRYLGDSRKQFNLFRGGGTVAWFLRHFYNHLRDMKLRVVCAEERKGRPTLHIGEDLGGEPVMQVEDILKDETKIAASPCLMRFRE